MGAEGGRANVQGDRGGATNQGVSIVAARNYWRGGKLPFDFDGDGEVTEADIQQVHLHPEVRDAFYRSNYWGPVRGDQLVTPIAYSLFDWAVTSGPATAIKHTQEGLFVPLDGFMGPNTIEAFRRLGVQGTCRHIAKRRLMHIIAITSADPSQWKFEDGWRNRVMDVLWLASRMDLEGA